MVSLPDRLIESCAGKGIVVMAGAGVSSAPPARLPGWYDLNRQIVEALGRRVETYLERANYTLDFRNFVGERRNAGAFPPDYQAQILEEICGESYFRSLRCLDAETPNPGHDAIARLARQGIVRAVVTTNFDRLIERALDQHGVAYEVAYEPVSYSACLRKLEAAGGALPVLKVHGSVQDPLSMIDTLKQRLLGRNCDLLSIVDTLLARNHWLFAGFSAADLESDENYLGLVAAAPTSPGITYLVWPGHPVLGAGAQKLLDAYGDKATRVDAELSDVGQAISASRGMEWPTFQETTEAHDIRANLTVWADSLTPAAAVNCLAGLAEAGGAAVWAFELLHRFWEDVHPSDRSGADFEQYRFLHGRLGIGRGLLSLAQLDSTSVEESLQNLLRRAGDGDARAAMWSALAFLWGGKVEFARQQMGQSAAIAGAGHLSPEASADAVLAASEAVYFWGEWVEWFLGVWQATANRVRDAGDLPRQAALAARALLFFADFEPQRFREIQASDAMAPLRPAQRLHDPDVEAFIYLAQGRWLTRNAQAAQSQEFLNAAIEYFVVSGRVPWRLHSIIEYSKSLMDAGYLDRAGEQLETIREVVTDRYPLLLVSLLEAGGQLFRLTGETERSRERFSAAHDLATEWKMTRRAVALSRDLEISKTHSGNKRRKIGRDWPDK